jgi:hypothetical protein
MKMKRFDCVDMMHRGAKRIYRATKNLSRSQELEYWRQKAAELLPRHTKLVDNRAAARRERKVR